MRPRRRRGVGVRPIGARGTLAAGLMACAVAVSCGDGTPGFCAPLAEAADLRALSTALERGDFAAARAEAQGLRELSEEAPTEIRADFSALADAVGDIVELLEQADRSSTASEEAPGVGAADVERRREDLNSRFGDLDLRANRISTWAARECGLDLS